MAKNANSDTLRLMACPAKKEGKIWIKSLRPILQGHVAPRKNSGKKRVHRKELFKSVNLPSSIRVRQNLSTGHSRKFCNKKDAPAE